MTLTLTRKTRRLSNVKWLVTLCKYNVSMGRLFTQVNPWSRMGKSSLICSHTRVGLQRDARDEDDGIPARIPREISGLWNPSLRRLARVGGRKSCGIPFPQKRRRVFDHTTLLLLQLQRQKQNPPPLDCESWSFDSQASTSMFSEYLLLTY